MKNMTAKELARKHYYGIKKLTPKEKHLVENSPFSHVLKGDNSSSQFYNLLEQYIEDTNIDDIILSKQERFGVDEPRLRNKLFYIDKRIVNKLINEVEEKFNIGMYNTGLGRYKNVDCKALSNYIRDFIKRELLESYNEGTAKKLNDIAEECNTPYQTMYRLYLLRKY